MTESTLKPKCSAQKTASTPSQSALDSKRASPPHSIILSRHFTARLFPSSVYSKVSPLYPYGVCSKVLLHALSFYINSRTACIWALISTTWTSRSFHRVSSCFIKVFVTWPLKIRDSWSYLNVAYFCFKSSSWQACELKALLIILRRFSPLRPGCWPCWKLLFDSPCV